jgi:hypothetical protein
MKKKAGTAAYAQKLMSTAYSESVFRTALFINACMTTTRIIEIPFMTSIYAIRLESFLPIHNPSTNNSNFSYIIYHIYLDKNNCMALKMLILSLKSSIKKVRLHLRNPTPHY